MTGFSFHFVETSIFPNYDALGQSFIKGQTYLEQRPPVDYLDKDGRAYLYFGPGPTLFHIPSRLLLDSVTPTGLIIVMLMTFSVVVFEQILSLLSEDHQNTFIIKLVFVLVYAFNGVSLLMVTIPSIHHEAIVSGMFFLLCSVYFSFRIMKTDSNHIKLGLIAGMCFAMTILCRFSYVLSIFFLCLVQFLPLYRHSEELKTIRLKTAITLLMITSIGLIVTLVYNDIRFGSPTDFGVDYMVSMYQKYFQEGYYFRYDHIPYNVWSYFFQLPDFVGQFPFIKLPFQILQVNSIRSNPYFLLHVNELAASVFLLIPILLFSFNAGLQFRDSHENQDTLFTLILSLLLVSQLLPLCLTLASIARYYFDFLPILLLLSFVGYLRVRQKGNAGYLLLVFSALISLIISFSVVINGLMLYRTFIQFESPLLRLFLP
jgi:hypothetical protein